MHDARALRLASCLLLLPVFASAAHGQVLGGTLGADTTLTAEAAPWLVTETLVVGDGITLEIAAGAEVRFESDAGIRVTNGGTLRVEGRPDARVLLTRLADSSERWRGIQFDRTDGDNLLRHADLYHADGGSEAVRVERARLTIEGARWTDTDRRVLYVDHPRVLVRDSEFPAADGIEPVNGQSLDPGEYFILRGNTFHAATGYNDIVDFSDCERPGPVLEVYDNLFLGGSDDGLDIDGCDAHIEGNTFIGFHKGHGGSSTSNAIATGFRYDRTANITVVRNVFVDNDHAILLKEDAFLWAEHNVFYGSTTAAINFSEWPDRDVDPARGAYLAGNIFAENAAVFQNRSSQPGFADPEVVVHRSILPEALHELGTGNLDLDPRFVDPPSDFGLRPDSPALGAGPMGLDMGAFVASGVYARGPEPGAVPDDELRIDVGGPGITAFRYAVNDSAAGSWSETVEIREQPALVLSDLPPGSNTIFLRGRSFTGVWHDRTAVLGPYELTGSISSTEPMPSATLRISVTPNPFDDVAVIRLDGQLADSIIEVFDLLGRRVALLRAEDNRAGRLAWDGRGMAAGIYLLSVRTPQGRTIRPIVKAR